MQYYKQSIKIRSDYQVWQEGFHPQQIISEEMLQQKIDYLHYNPGADRGGGRGRKIGSTPAPGIMPGEGPELSWTRLINVWQTWRFAG